jgi:hypothetical protein
MPLGSSAVVHVLDAEPVTEALEKVEGTVLICKERGQSPYRETQNDKVERVVHSDIE